MKKHPLLSFLLLSFGITWGLAGIFFLLPDLVTATFGPASPQNPLFVLAASGPSLSAFIVTAVAEGKPGVTRLLKCFLPGRVKAGWYLLVLVALPAISLLLNLVSGSPVGLFSIGLQPLLVFLFFNLITGPLGEEFGWRGFALPRLLQKLSPTVASLLIGVIWALWHLPSFFVSGLPQGAVQIPLFALGALALSVVATWAFINTNGSIFFPFLLHYMVNFSLSVIAIPFLHMTLLQTAFAAALLLYFGWDLTGPRALGPARGAPDGSPAQR